MVFIIFVFTGLVLFMCYLIYLESGFSYTLFYMGFTFIFPLIGCYVRFYSLNLYINEYFIFCSLYEGKLIYSNPSYLRDNRAPSGTLWFPY